MNRIAFLVPNQSAGLLPMVLQVVLRLDHQLPDQADVVINQMSVAHPGRVSQRARACETAVSLLEPHLIHLLSACPVQRPATHPLMPQLIVPLASLGRFAARQRAAS